MTTYVIKLPAGCEAYTQQNGVTDPKAKITVPAGTHKPTVLQAIRYAPSLRVEDETKKDVYGITEECKAFIESSEGGNFRRYNADADKLKPWPEIIVNTDGDDKREFVAKARASQKKAKEEAEANERAAQEKRRTDARRQAVVDLRVVCERLKEAGVLQGDMYDEITRNSGLKLLRQKQAARAKRKPDDVLPSPEAKKSKPGEEKDAGGPTFFGKLKGAVKGAVFGRP